MFVYFVGMMRYLFLILVIGIGALSIKEQKNNTFVKNL